MFLIGFFSKRQKFHIVEQRETMDEVEAYLRNHDYGHFQKLVVFCQVSRPTPRAVDGGQAGENNGQVALPTATNASRSASAEHSKR